MTRGEAGRLAAGFREAFRTVRMTRGDPAAEDPRGLWALGGLEKG